MNLKLQLLPDGQTWGMYVKPDDNIAINTGQTITVGGNQITIVMPKNYAYWDLESVQGNWVPNAVVNGPAENPTKSYVSFGFTSEAPPIPYVAGQETLLFKFKTTSDCPSTMYLIDNATDPFNHLPNSIGSNPGIELAVFDFLAGNTFSYKGTYAPAAWDCKDNDNDGIKNALEDTNGNGVFDNGVDASDLNNPGIANPTTDINLKLQLMPDGQTWGVYVKPDDAVSMSNQTITGQAQVTAVMPKDYEWTGLQSISGTWVVNATVNGTQFTPNHKYVSFGMTSDFPHINYVTGSETLLFSFKMQDDCPAEIYLIDNETDPLVLNYDVLNPATEFAIFDPINPNLYSVTSNYAPAAWDCHDNDNDGILNAHEDTNGNGIFDDGVDTSDLNNPDFAGENTDAFKFKLQLLPDGETMGLYVKPDENITINTSQTITIGGSQITLVAPFDFAIVDFENVNGNWQHNAFDNGPVENPTKKYLSFGFQSEAPPIPYVAGQETLLFTFKTNGDCPSSIQIIDNATDPFNQLPNSHGSNPGNFFEVFDIISEKTFSFAGTYAPAAWDCHDNDNDGILNAHEDTNGNGVFDAGVDASDLNNQGIAKVMNLKLQLMPDGQTMGVYVKPDGNITISTGQTITIGGNQITVVMPKDYAFWGIENVNGNWAFNAFVNGPIENPTKQYASFGFQSEAPPIPYVPGQETLLFTFKIGNNCPDSMYLIDNATDPFNQLPNRQNSNPYNEYAVFDMITGNFFNFKDTYAPAAWDCHDNDNDGIPNALEDTNGNGVFDDGVDASDLNSASQLGTGCVLLKLQMLPDSTGWGVFAKPSNGYLPSANAVATGGQVTIVAPESFDFAGLESAVGQWTLASTLHAQPNSPSRKYLTLEMANSTAALDLNTDGGTMLFRFDKLGDCPDSLYILENNIPASLSANEFSGTDPNSFTASGFEYCGVYARKAWRCKPTAPSGPIIFVGEEEFTGGPQPDTDKLGNGLPEGKKPKAQDGDSFTLSPNPAGDFVSILVSPDLAEGQKNLALWDLQGKKYQEILLENTATQLDLSGLPAGVYFVSLAQNGRVVERKKLIKN